MADITVTVESSRVIEVVDEGPQGPKGDAAVWLQLTQAQFDALSPPDPTTLYIIVN